MQTKYKTGDMIQHQYNKKGDSDLYLVVDVGETHYKIIKVSNQEKGQADIHLIDKMNEVSKV